MINRGFMRIMICILFCVASSSCFSKSNELINVIELSDNHLDTKLMKKMKKTFQVDVLVETGTFTGDTAAKARDIFKEIHTIELSPHYHSYATQKLSGYPNIHCHLGHSGDVLNKIIPQINGRILFWLDAHWSGSDTAKGNTNSAICEEITAIKRSGVKDSVILIDDIRAFQGFSESVTEFYGGYPSINRLKELILEINSDYEFWIIGDVALAYPSQEAVAPSSLVKACTQSRLFDSLSASDGLQIIAEEKTILNAAYVKESKNIMNIYNAFATDAFQNLTYHYSLWEGLVFLGRHDYKKAEKCFNQVLQGGYTHWRVYWYLANAAFKAGNYKLSSDSIEKVLEASPDFNEAKMLKTQIEKKCAY